MSQSSADAMEQANRGTILVTTDLAVTWELEAIQGLSSRAKRGICFPRSTIEPSPLPRIRRSQVLRAACGEDGTMIAQREAKRNAG